METGQTPRRGSPSRTRTPPRPGSTQTAPAEKNNNNSIQMYSLALTGLKHISDCARRKEINVLVNKALNIFYLRLYGNKRIRAEFFIFF